MNSIFKYKTSYRKIVRYLGSGWGQPPWGSSPWGQINNAYILCNKSTRAYSELHLTQALTLKKEDELSVQYGTPFISIDKPILIHIPNVQPQCGDQLIDRRTNIISADSRIAMDAIKPLDAAKAKPSTVYSEKEAA